MLILTATADVSLSSRTIETALVPAVYLGKAKNNTVLFIKIYDRNDFRTIRVCDRDCTVKQKANWIGHILRRNCLLQHVIEGKIKGQIEVTRWRGRKRKKLLDDLKDRRGYCQLKEEALDRTMWRNRFGRGFGPVVWQITDDDEDDDVMLILTATADVSLSCRTAETAPVPAVYQGKTKNNTVLFIKNL